MDKFVVPGFSLARAASGRRYCCLLSADCRLLTGSGLLLSAFCFLPTAFRLLLSAFCFLPSALLQRVRERHRSRRIAPADQRVDDAVLHPEQIISRRAPSPLRPVTKRPLNAIYLDRL